MQTNLVSPSTKTTLALVTGDSTELCFKKRVGFNIKHFCCLPLILPFNMYTGDWQFYYTNSFPAADSVKVSRMKKIVGNFTKTYPF